MGQITDLTGNRYGRLVVIEIAEKNKTGRTRWRCKCDCGNEAIVIGSNLQKGTTKSCGCLKIENSKAKIIDL